MKDKVKYYNGSQLSIEDYLQENTLETEDNVEVPSILSVSELNEVDTKPLSNVILERILSRDNMNMAYKRVKANKGAGGIDGMTVNELLPFLKENGNKIKESIRKKKYNPKAVRRVEIPKPDGSKRKLGIPTVVDRVIQQAVAQELSRIYEPMFSDRSYGFRPKRSCHDAIRKVEEIVNRGYTWVVDIDLEKFFDTVNHDLLISIIRRTINEDKVVSLIRKYLQAGVLENGLFRRTEKGTPQGGNISPILSNIMLNELDQELERRGLEFVRYADDLEIFVKSEKAARRVLESVTRYIETKLKLKVNRDKSKIDRPWRTKYLGFSFFRKEGKVRIRVHEKSIKRLKDKIRKITGRRKAKTMLQRFRELRQLFTGWYNYFKLAELKRVARDIDGLIRRRLRMCYWKQWKKPWTKYTNLKKLGIPGREAWLSAKSSKNYWRMAQTPIINKAISNKVLKEAGFISLTDLMGAY